MHTPAKLVGVIAAACASGSSLHVGQSSATDVSVGLGLGLGASLGDAAVGDGLALGLGEFSAGDPEHPASTSAAAAMAASEDLMRPR